MIPIKRIVFEQVEGLAEDCRELTFTTWAAAEAHVVAAARKSPSDSSYFKCDVGIEWADGAVRGFRFDMNRKHVAEAHPLASELRSELMFFSKRWVPSHTTAEKRDRYVDYINELSPGTVERAAKLLDGYDVGVKGCGTEAADGFAGAVCGENGVLCPDCTGRV